MEEKNICETCSDFEPQTWRKSLCKNCFHTLEEHSEELLAKEGEDVAKEKAASKSSGTPSDLAEEKIDASKSKDAPVSAGKEADNKEHVTDASSEKSSLGKIIKRKYGSSGDESTTWSWAKDLGREYGKSGKPSSQDTRKAAKGTSPVLPSATPAIPVSTSSLSTTAPDISTTVPSLLPSVPALTTTASTLTTTASASSSTVASASTSKTSPVTFTKSSAKTSSQETLETSSTPAESSDTTSVSISKTKSFASKFESKASALSQNKQSSKPPDIRPGGSNVAALTGKLTDNTSDSKTQPKPASEKSIKTSLFKLDTKLSSKASEETKDETKEPIVSTIGSKISQNDSKDNVKIDSKQNRSDSKSTPQTSKSENTISKLPTSVLSKTVPFGKDMLKSTKDVSKKESAIASFVDNKTKSSQLTTNDSVKEKDVVDSESGGDASSRSLVKDEIGTTETSISKDYNDEKIKNVEGIEVSLTTTETIVTDIDNNTSKQESNEEVGAVCSSRDIKLTEPGYSSDVRHLANNTGRNYDAYTDVASSSNENLKETKNTEDFVRKGQEIEGDTSRSSSKNVKTDSVRNVGYQPGGNEKSQVVEGEYKSDTPVACVLSSSQETTAVASTSTDITVTKSTSPSNDSKPSSSIHQTTSTSDEQDKEQDSPCVQSSLQKFNHLEDISKKDDSISDTKSQFSVSLLERGQRDGSVDSRKDETEKVSAHDRNIIESLSDEIKKKDENLFDLTQQLYTMEEKVKLVEEERDILRKTSLQTEEFEQIEKESMWTQEESIETQIEDTEKLLNDLRSQLSKMEEQCFRLEKDNRSLHDKLQTQEVCVKRDQASRGKNNDNVVLEEDLEAAEKELEDVKEENKELQSHIMEMKNEMNEMYDHFRESEHDEFREIQKELDIAAKNCRILQFKLRKAERRNDQVEQDRIHYEDKLRTLQDQFDSQDAKNHIRALEEELRMAKEVSVRLHDELDVVEDKRNKALEENRHLTDLLEHTDKRQFRMEMEIDKLRDIVSDLQQQLKEAKGSNNNKESTPDRKVLSSIYTRSID